ncbi:MAG: hexosyltransferase [Chloroflexi bacterium]|nr:MAG: hexosyltransferase [Chloroflexota bacterium]
MKLAFVPPWYGRDIPGGAEAETRRTAVHLQRAGFTVEILTTCIRDLYADWGQNFHQPGTSIEEGLPVRRFAVTKRNKQAFDQVNWQLMQGQTISAAEEQIFLNEMFHCPDLLAYIEAHQSEYLFIFTPYMFSSTYFGAQINPKHSLMIPCLHDEAYARLKIHQQVIPHVKALLFYAQAEAELAERLFPANNGQIRQVVGGGIDTDWHGDGEHFRQKYQLKDTPIVLYAGRREPGKNTPLLIQYWQRFIQANGHKAKLVLIGAGHVDIPDTCQEFILDLGYVPVQDKYNAFAAANIFCMPSVHESFSVVIMESWLTGSPVLVHGDCAVTREHCLQANGGLYFTNYSEFEATVNYLLAHPETAVTLGNQGRHYVLAHYQWKTVIARYQDVFNRILNT